MTKEIERLPAAGRRSFVAYSSESEIHMTCVRTLEKKWKAKSVEARVEKFHFNRKPQPAAAAPQKKFINLFIKILLFGLCSLINDSLTWLTAVVVLSASSFVIHKTSFFLLSLWLRRRYTRHFNVDVVK